MSIDVEDERGARIALVQGRTEKQLMANAALISAAPELMRELVGVLEEWEEGECDEVVLVESRIKRIKAAIAKAEGRTK